MVRVLPKVDGSQSKREAMGEECRYCRKQGFRIRWSVALADPNL
jgi:hypothetical protein